MQASKRAFFKRGGAACAAAAVLIGGTLTAGAASATPSAEPTSSASEASLPGGLAEALQRDLGMSVAEFNAQGDLAAKASTVQSEVSKVDAGAVVSLSGDSIKVQTSAPDVAKAAAGDTKLAIAPAKAAQSPSTVDAASVDALFSDYVKTFGAGNLQSVMRNGNGEFVIRTGEPAAGESFATQRSFTAAATPSIDDFAAKYANVVIKAADGPAAPLAGEVTNGQGYASHFAGPNYGLCSIGWNGFDKTGKRAIISAGHCTHDGSLTNTELTVPSQDDAADPVIPGFELGEPLGAFGFSQFGGPGNSPATGLGGAELGNIGTDVSVMDDINPALNQLAMVTDWKTPASLKDSGRTVTGVSDAIVGTDICKSGRTTGWSCGTVKELGIFLVRGTTYPADPVDPTDPNLCDPTPTVPECADLRVVRGFGSVDLTSAGGDSGGSIISGTMAVGMVSAGSPGITFGVSLTDALAHTDGYSVKIFLEAPKVTTTAPLYRNGAINGTVAGAPAGTTVKVTIGSTTKEVPVGPDGTWVATAPNAFGPFTVSVQAMNGFSTSASTVASLDVVKETLAAPAFTAPALNGSAAAPVTAITGTGTAGATVTLGGDATGTAVVGTDGNWSVAVTPGLPVGSYTVTAKQSRTDWNDSPSVTNTFTVVPGAPAVTSPSNGQEFAFDQGPSVISGTNIDGATVTLTINGQQYKATVVGGTWSFTFTQKFLTGSHNISVVQNVDGVESLISTSSFTVLAAPAPPATPVPTPEPAPAPVVNTDKLAATGASSTLLVLGGAGALMLAGGAAFLLFRRRNATK